MQRWLPEARDTDINLHAAMSDKKTKRRTTIFDPEVQLRVIRKLRFTGWYFSAAMSWLC